MARKRSPYLDYLVYLVVRSVVCVLQALSWDLAQSFAEGIAWIAYRVDRRHRLVAAENLQHAFPGITPGEVDRIVRQVYRHFTLMVVEMVKAPRVLHAHNLGNYFHYPEPDRLERCLELMRGNRPTILLTGHVGNWEVYGHAIGLFGPRVAIIGRPLDNPYLDRLINSFRTASGHQVIAKHGDYDRINNVMKEGGNLGVLADQDAGEKGLYVDFFGRPASTFKSIALLALEYQAVIIIAAPLRTKTPLHYVVHVEDFIDTREYEQTPGAVKTITQRYTSALEGIVRRAPEQYLWLHRRWKHQPAPRKSKRAA